MVTSCWQRARCSFVRPDCSLPSSIATRFPASFVQIVSAHSRGFTTGTTMLRRRALEREVREPHRLHRARGRADVAGVRGFDEHDADGDVHGLKRSHARLRVAIRCVLLAADRLPRQGDYSTLRAEMHGMVNIAVRAARRAGELMVRQLNRLEALTVAEKSRNEFVTQVDEAAEAAIIEVIRDHYPEHSILAEESGASGGEHEYQW